jgi:hypothetical protein
MLNCSQQDISLSRHVGEIRGATMTDGNRGVSGEEQESERTSDDGAAADHDGMAARDFDSVMTEQKETAERGTGGYVGLPESESSLLSERHTIDILFGRDEVREELPRNASWQWLEREDAGDRCVIAELLDEADEFCLARGFFQCYGTNIQA